MKIRLRFASIEERDVFIREHFPVRKCEEEPGCFIIPDWGYIVVFCEQVTLFPSDQLERLYELFTMGGKR